MNVLENPKVSVVIQTWNRAELISSAIESVLNQTLQPIEILICDDGSTDETFRIVDSFAIKDSRVKWVPGKRSGFAAAPRNRGLFEAKGDWIAFIDSDDVWRKDKLMLQLEGFKNQLSQGWSVA